MKRALLLAALLCPAVLVAQAKKAGPKAAANAAVMVQHDLWMGMTKNITTAAEEWPESDYNWKPVETVRSFGELVAHVAGAQYAICAPALGEPARAEDDVEKNAKTKATIVESLKKSTEYCERAYKLSDAQSMRPAEMFGMKRNALFALSLNASHNSEHYGNIVTYMRMRGMVPPSSRGQ